MSRVSKQRRALAEHRGRLGLHEELGRELLVNRSAEGWTDLFAAVTAWAEAGRFEQATNLLDWSRTQVTEFAGRENLNVEIDHMASWVEQERKK